MTRANWLTLALSIVVVAGIALLGRACTPPSPIVTPTATPTDTPTIKPPSATPWATPRSVRGAAANAPLAPTVVPILYKFFDWATDFQHANPEYGPVGSIHFTTWGEINPSSGVYDWSGVDAALAAEAALRVTMPDGAEIPKPVVIQVEPFLSSAWNWDAIFFDATPQWVYWRIGDRPEVNGRLVGHRLESEGKVAVVPMYDSDTWRNAFFEMVRAFGAKYNDDPRVTAVVICVGLDGETQLVKEAGGVPWDAIVDSQAAGTRYRFNNFVYDAMDVYREAFPTKPIFINNAPGGSGMRQATSEGAATYYTPPIGLKNSSLWIDQDSHEGRGDYYGRWDAQRYYSMTTPIFLESVFGMGGPEAKYWTMLAGLHYHPQAIDLHPQFFTDSQPEWLRFTSAHLGRTLADTPDIWCVLRDSEYPVQMWNGGLSGISGKVGDWTYWLSRVDIEGSKAPRVWRQDIPAGRESVYARQARRTDQAAGQPCMSFVADEEWQRAAPYTVYVTLLNTGKDSLALQYRLADGTLISQPRSKGATLGAVDDWVTVAFTVPLAWSPRAMDGADFRLSCEGDGDEYVHMIRVTGRQDDGQVRPTAWPTATSKPTPTPQPTAKVSPTFPVIPSSTPTATPTVTATLSARRGVVNLSVGWNLVSSPYAGEVEIGLALASIAGKVEIVYSYGNTGGAALWRKWTPGAGPALNTLATIRPDEGYWVLATQDCEW